MPMTWCSCRIPANLATANAMFKSFSTNSCNSETSRAPYCVWYCSAALLDSGGSINRRVGRVGSFRMLRYCRYLRRHTCQETDAGPSYCALLIQRPISHRVGGCSQIVAEVTGRTIFNGTRSVAVTMSHNDKRVETSHRDCHRSLINWGDCEIYPGIFGGSHFERTLAAAYGSSWEGARERRNICRPRVRVRPPAKNNLCRRNTSHQVLHHEAATRALIREKQREKSHSKRVKCHRRRGSRSDDCDSLPRCNQRWKPARFAGIRQEHHVMGIYNSLQILYRRFQHIFRVGSCQETGVAGHRQFQRNGIYIGAYFQPLFSSNNFCFPVHSIFVRITLPDGRRQSNLCVVDKGFRHPPSDKISCYGTAQCTHTYKKPTLKLPAIKLWKNSPLNSNVQVHRVSLCHYRIQVPPIHQECRSFPPPPPLPASATLLQGHEEGS
eukprot:284817981_4